MKKTHLLIYLLLLTSFVNAKKEKTVSFHFLYSMRGGENTERFQLACLIPSDIPHRQQIEEIIYSESPTRIYEEGENTYAEFLIAEPFVEKEITISVKMKLLSPGDYKTLSRKKTTNPLSQELLKDYLVNEKYIDCDTKEVQEKAEELKGRDRMETLFNIYKFVTSEIKYSGFHDQPLGTAKDVLCLRHGDCTEFTHLFVALCRAASIPARPVFGLCFDSSVTPRHAWAEVYIDRIGWVAFEPTSGTSKAFKKLKNNYITLSVERNIPELNIHTGNLYQYIYWGEKPKIKEYISLYK